MRSLVQESIQSKELCQRLDLAYPVIQGGMAGISTAEFVLAASRAGILGTLSTYGLSLATCQAEIRKLKATKLSFSCNLMLKHPAIEALAALMIAEKVPIVTVSAGYRPDIVKELQAAGIIVLAVVGSPQQAEKMAALAVDYLILEGMESGGHVGTYPLATLVEAVVKKYEIPFIAAGGIGAGTSLNHYLSLGAAGIQLGTALLLTVESPLPEKQKQALILAQEKDFKVTTSKAGMALRGLETVDGVIPCGLVAGKIFSILSLKERLKDILLITTEGE